MADSPYPIKRWPKHERPRERLLQHGPQHLTEAELLGILLGKGTKERTAVDVARQLVPQYESLQKLFSRSPSN
jgi:DNA repair protein RadC